MAERKQFPLRLDIDLVEIIDKRKGGLSRNELIARVLRQWADIGSGKPAERALDAASAAKRARPGEDALITRTAEPPPPGLPAPRRALEIGKCGVSGCKMEGPVGASCPDHRSQRFRAAGG